MYIVSIFSIVALLFTFLESRGRFQNGMFYGFCLVTFLGCIHYDYGNDYMNYLNIYEDVIFYNHSIIDVFENGHRIYGQTGWHLLCYLFQYLGGFFMMVAILNIFMNYC